MNNRAAILAELLQDPMRARLVPRADAEELLVELARVMKALEVLPASAAAAPAVHRANADRLLDVHEAARRLGMTERQLYRRSGRLPFTVKVGPSTLRFSEHGIERWQIEKQVDGRGDEGVT